MKEINMVFTIQDIILILGYLATLIATYVAISGRIVKLESKQEVLDNKISYIDGISSKDRDKFDIEKNNIWRKLADIEAGQGRTNIFLEENLKTLTKIISTQEIRMERLEESVRQLQYDTK
jgi:hypothetical protein